MEETRKHGTMRIRLFAMIAVLLLTIVSILFSFSIEQAYGGLPGCPTVRIETLECTTTRDTCAEANSAATVTCEVTGASSPCAYAWTESFIDIFGNMASVIICQAYSLPTEEERDPEISVYPASLDFGYVTVGFSSDRSFTVGNTGGGTLGGTVTGLTAPFSCVSGCSYGIGSGGTHTVTIRFSPTATSTFRGTANFEGGGNAMRPVSGIGVLPPSITSFTGNPGSIHRGQRVLLSWHTVNTTGCIGFCREGGDCGDPLQWGANQRPNNRLSSQDVPEPRVYVSPRRTTTYVLQCVNAADDFVTRYVTINVFRLWWREVVPVFPFIEEMLGLVLPARPGARENQ